MNTVQMPAGYQRVMPYLIVKDAEKFLDFATAVFGAKERLREMREVGIIRHAEIEIGASVIMVADAFESYASQPSGLFIYVENADRTYSLALEHGASSINPVADHEYGRSGGILDPFGNTWWLTSSLAQIS